ncbi:MAG TPA: winged helix DNA-binding domain-containing protein [Candidatus Limnocylindrales bacterium]|nr:winged helix DNA-binding domain-containing protein [Candidatus Limnocylindrales bacterium]
MPERTLTQRHLNRALLARQHLLERSRGTLVEAIEQVGGLQTQYAPSGYVGLWTRVAGFRRDDLTAALEDRSIVQATLMRTTIHMVSGREFWRYALGVRRARREWAARVQAVPAEAELQARAAALRAALADGPRAVKELDGLAGGFVGNLGLWVDLVRVPPSGTWERRRADRLALAERWVGPEDATEAEGLEQLVRAYLRGFGPAPWRDIASWAGLPVADAQRGGEHLDLVRYRDEAGRELVDLAGLSIPDPDAPAPVRFLPHWDNTLLVHARRTGLLPEVHRPRVFSTKNPFSVGTVLVDGRVVAGWALREGRIVTDPYEDLGAADARAVEGEREALEAFHA